MRPERRALYVRVFALWVAEGNFREYLRGEVVWRKKYLYVLRPLLAMRWIEAGLGVVPIEFSRLLDATVADEDLRGAIEGLLEAKRSGNELDDGPRIPTLSQFIESELGRTEGVKLTRRETSPPIAELDAIFRATLREAWAGEGPV